MLAVFLFKSKLALQKWLALISLWTRDCPMVDVMNVAVDIMQWVREVCRTKLLQTCTYYILRGLGVVVQIDESLFHQKLR